MSSTNKALVAITAELRGALQAFLADHHASEQREAAASAQEGCVQCACDLCEQGRAALMFSKSMARVQR